MNSPYDDGRHYDALFPGPNDLPFYLRQIAAYGQPVLELACGTGRLTVPIARSGVDITGIDSSASMLEAARRKAAEAGVPASFQLADMRQYDLGRKFGLIFIACNSFSHLLQHEDIASCLTCTLEHLEPGGRFVVDIFTPALKLLTRTEPLSIGAYDDPDGRGRVTVTATNHYNTATQINEEVWHCTNTATRETRDIPFPLRMFYPQEIDALLRCHGFSIEHKYGSFEEHPYGDGAPKQLIVCRR